MPALIACDLDRTLIYSPKAFWLDTADSDAPPIVVSELWNGVPISFMTRAAEGLLAELGREADVVPVTTRTVAQYQRVQLRAAGVRFAVTSNGGSIVVDGVEDASWRAGVRARVAAEAAPLPEVSALLADLTATPWITKVNIAEELFVYAIVDRESMPADWLAELTETCAAFRWSVSVQGRKLYCVPEAVTKHEAVAEVARRLGARTVLAAGDSLLDRSMLEHADIAFRPAHGELHDAGYDSPGLVVTAARGILAGEELTQRLLATVRSLR